MRSFIAIFLLGGVASALGAEPIRAPAEIAAEYGKLLFSDPTVMSADGRASCATCHNPSLKFGYSNGRRIAVGRQVSAAPFGILGTRNVPSLIGVGRREDKLLNADGRSRGLMQVALQAVGDRQVLGGSLSSMAASVAVNPRYQELNRRAFGQPVSAHHVASAIVYYLRTIDSPDVPADLLYAGLKTALPPSAERGWLTFKKHCTSCHDPANDWRDDDFHNVGVSSYTNNSDVGRAGVTGLTADRYRFATPSLREVGKTQPYMHDGCFATLRDCVKWFQRGGRFEVRGQLVRDRTIDPLVAAISFSDAEAVDLEAFLTLGFQGERYPGLKGGGR